ncbi:hypothetical protein [Moraxella lacunata]|uniref:hypothetical protein n=1 Tax=Moraxella lacunata TaxID=477 RepID=UPI003EE3B4DD
MAVRSSPRPLLVKSDEPIFTTIRFGELSMLFPYISSSSVRSVFHRHIVVVIIPIIIVIVR